MTVESLTAMSWPDRRSPTPTFPWTPSRCTPAGTRSTGWSCCPVSI